MTHQSNNKNLLDLSECAWLITGGCGFIGTNLITRILTDYPNASIRVLDNLSAGRRENLANVYKYTENTIKNINSLPSPDSNTRRSAQGGGKSRVELIVGDIRDYKTYSKCCEGINIIVHLAADSGVANSVENPKYNVEVNVLGTFNMLEAARQKKVDKFIFASSGAPLGEVEPPLHEDIVPVPVSPYGASKLAGEGYCSAYYRTFDLATVALRFGNVYGPGSQHKSSVIAKFIRQAIRGETLEIYGDGKQTRDFIYVEDLVRAIVLAVKVNEISGEVFQIATNVETSLNELVQELLPILNNSGFCNVNVHNVELRRGDVLRNYSSISKARQMLQWEAKVDIVDGLSQTVEWFIKF